VANYAVVYTVESNRRLTGQAVPYAVHFPDGASLSLLLMGRLGRSTTGALLPGFTIESTIEAVSADAAITRTRPLVELFTYAMVLASPGRYERPRLDLVVPIRERDGEILEMYEIPLPPRPSEEIDLTAVATAYGAFMAPVDDERSMWRLEHAASWLARGLSAGDRASRMIYVYTGLDVLNEMLEADHFDLRTGGQSHGVAGWLASRDSALEESARRTRNDVVHGNFPIMELDERLASVDHPLTTALREAIWHLLRAEAPPWQADGLDSGVLRTRLDVILRGRIRASHKARLADAEHTFPSFGAVIEVREQEVLSDGRLNLTLGVLPHPRVGSGVRLDLLAVDVLRPADVVVRVAQSAPLS
jgi:hypothetical protein